MMLVLDASILVKLFRDEDDSPIARSLIGDGALQNRAMIAPTIVMYETLAAALHYEIAFELVLNLVGSMKRAGFRLIEPTAAEWMKAETIAKASSPLMKPPSLQDSLYHALALRRGGTLITADRKYFEKTRSLGAIAMLADWVSLERS